MTESDWERAREACAAACEAKVLDPYTSAFDNGCLACAAAIRALPHPEQIEGGASPEGMVSVPAEPTKAMREAFIAEVEEISGFPAMHQHLIAIDAYKAMLAAAQPKEQK